MVGATEIIGVLEGERVGGIVIGNEGGGGSESVVFVLAVEELLGGGEGMDEFGRVGVLLLVALGALGVVVVVVVGASGVVVMVVAVVGAMVEITGVGGVGSELQFFGLFVHRERKSAEQQLRSKVSQACEALFR